MGVMKFVLSDELEHELRMRHKKKGDFSIMAEEAFVDYLRKLDDYEIDRIESIVGEALQHNILSIKTKHPDMYEELKSFGFPDYEIIKIIDWRTLNESKKVKTS